MNFSKPMTVNNNADAFSMNVFRLMPEYKDIPNEYKSSSNRWTKWQAAWFLEGLNGFPDARKDIDAKDAMRHLSVIQRSFAPQHEHKQAAVAYLASMWLENPTEPKEQQK